MIIVLKDEDLWLILQTFINRSKENQYSRPIAKDIASRIYPRKCYVGTVIKFDAWLTIAQTNNKT